MNALQRLLPLCAFLLGLGHISAQTLVHYWNFNNSASEAELLTPTLSLTGGAMIQHVMGGASAIQTTSNTGQGFDETNPNARNGDEALTHLRFNNPIGGSLFIALPTTGFQQVVVKYATRRSGSGAGTQIIEFTTDGISFDTLTTINPNDGDPTEQTLDFSSHVAVNDNAAFQIRITFAQGPGGDVGNNRFDNLTLDAIQAGDDTFPPVASFSPSCGSVDVETTIHPVIQFNEDIRLTNDSQITTGDIPNIVELRKDNAQGVLIPFTGTYENRAITINPDAPLENGSTYFTILLPQTVEDTSDNAIGEVQICDFTTITVQTVFVPGDLVPVAYRMNASDAEDAVAILTFVDILPGTKVNLADAKYTTNPQPQCSGGITWTSPETLVPAGTVITIGNDEGVASVGTIAGSTFGLSSNGDQVIVYTGTAANPSHITAMSSNAWVTGDHTACGGSFSLIPAGLADGISAINLSTAPGNTGGNTVNAYYSGPQVGSDTELRSLILDPANWNGIGEGTPAQIWPDFGFPGPPAVASAWVLNQNQIQLSYNHDMDPVSATDVANYTGISDLTNIAMTDNGSFNDTVTLTYGTPFVNGDAYTLFVQDVLDTDARPLSDVYTFSFTYVTALSFNAGYTSVNEGDGVATIVLTLTNPSISSVRLEYQGGVFSTADESDIDFPGVDLNFNGLSQSEVTIDIPIIDDQTSEQDEYVVIRLESITGVMIDGSQYFTVYIRDNDREAPSATEEIALDFVTRYAVDNPDEEVGLAEIVAYDPVSERLFTVSTALGQFDIIDFSDPTQPTTFTIVDITPHGSGITSIAVREGVVAVSVTGLNNEQENGAVVFYNANGAFQNKVTVGALPDMLTFTPDGHYVLVANEGQPNDAYTIDPEGSVSMIDISGGIAGVNQSHVTTGSFTQFNTQEADLLAAGVRKLKQESTFAQDFEPEYITVSPDGSTAWVTLQENNAVGVLDIDAKAFIAIVPLGTKDYQAVGNGLDLSDRNDFIHLSNWPLRGFYLPDAIANYEVDNTTYLVTANEGDEKEYAGLVERTTVGAVVLDETVFPNAEVLQENHNMGRFRISNIQGDTDGDGDYDELYCVGARSFSIWNAETGALVWDSGDAFEHITATLPYTASIFNADNEDNDFKGRSRAKGPEPEGITVSRLNGKHYAFITLERIGGVMVYDITDPAQPVFTDYATSRDNMMFSGDNGPEGVLHVSHSNGNHYLITANEVSGTLAVFQIQNVITSTNHTDAIADVGMYPNPVGTGTVYFSSPQSFELYDLNGKIITSGKEVHSFDVNILMPGMYIVRFANGLSRKLVVE